MTISGGHDNKKMKKKQTDKQKLYVVSEAETLSGFNFKRVCKN